MLEKKLNAAMISISSIASPASMPSHRASNLDRSIVLDRCRGGRLFFVQNFLLYHRRVDISISSSRAGTTKANNIHKHTHTKSQLP